MYQDSLVNVILCLGGNKQRLDVGIELAKAHPSATLVASSFGLKRSELTKQFVGAGLKQENFRIDYAAVDTIGNFVETLPIVKPLNPEIIWIVTDDYHMRRARTIADIVYSGLGYKLINYPCIANIPQEPSSKVNAERLQAITWKTTGLVIRDKKTLSRKADLERLSHE